MPSHTIGPLTEKGETDPMKEAEKDISMKEGEKHLKAEREGHTITLMMVVFLKTTKETINPTMLPEAAAHIEVEG